MARLRRSGDDAIPEWMRRFEPDPEWNAAEWWAAYEAWSARCQAWSRRTGVPLPLAVDIPDAPFDPDDL